MSRPTQNGELVESASRWGRKYRRGVHEVDRFGAIGDRHVHVQPENQQRAGELLELLDEMLIPLARRQDLVHPAREGMRPGRRDAQTHAIGRRHQLSPHAEDFRAQLVHVRADSRADLDD